MSTPSFTSARSALSSISTPSRGVLIVIAAIGVLAGVMAAQSTLTPAPVSQALSPATPGTTVAAPPQGSSSMGARAVMMVTVLAGLGIAFVLMRKRQLAGKHRTAPTMSLLGQLRIGGRWQVALVKVPGKTLVLGATDKGLNLLSTLDDGDLEAQAELARLDGTQSNRADLRGNRAEAELPDLDALVTDTDRVSLRADTTPPRPSPSRPLTRPPEPFARLLDELNQLPRTSSATGPIPTAQRDRMKTPEAQALRARLERYQSPTN
jgi:flagellar biogenesis protein FliO